MQKWAISCFFSCTFSWPYVRTGTTPWFNRIKQQDQSWTTCLDRKGQENIHTHTPHVSTNCTTPLPLFPPHSLNLITYVECNEQKEHMEETGKVFWGAKRVPMRMVPPHLGPQFLNIRKRGQESAQLAQACTNWRAGARASACAPAQARAICTIHRNLVCKNQVGITTWDLAKIQWVGASRRRISTSGHNFLEGPTWLNLCQTQALLPLLFRPVLSQD